MNCPNCGHAIEPAPKRPLTVRQREIFDFISVYISTNERSPSQQEIAAAFGFSSLSTVNEQLVMLRKKGWIHYPKNGQRAIEVIAA